MVAITPGFLLSCSILIIVLSAAKRGFLKFVELSMGEQVQCSQPDTRTYPISVFSRERKRLARETWTFIYQLQSHVARTYDCTRWIRPIYLFQTYTSSIANRWAFKGRIRFFTRVKRSKRLCARLSNLGGRYVVRPEFDILTYWKSCSLAKPTIWRWKRMLSMRSPVKWFQTMYSLV